MPTATVMVVDDSATELHMTKVCLERNGFHVLTATDGEEALEVASRDHPPIILLDIIMPKKNGYQVLRELRNNETTRSTKVVLVTSKNQESDRHWGMKQGADDYVTKPWVEADLISLVNRLLH